MLMRIELTDGNEKHWCEHECTPKSAYDTAGWLMAGILSKAHIRLTLKQRMELLPWNDEVIYFGKASLLS